MCQTGNKLPFSSNICLANQIKARRKYVEFLPSNLMICCTLLLIHHCATENGNEKNHYMLVRHTLI